jgi:MFS family permease
MIVADVVRAGLSLLLIPAFMAHNLLLIYAVAFTLSAFGTLFNPAKGAVIPLLVPAEQLTAANALSQTSQMLSTFIGPALAGLVFNLAGKGNEWVAFAINSASFVVSAVAVWSIRANAGKAPAGGIPNLSPQPPPLEGESTAISPPPPGVGSGERAVGPVRQVWHELLVGMRTLFGNRTMATLTAVLGITMLGIGAINVLWIVFLKTRFGFQDAELAGRVAIVDIAFSAGMVLASGIVGNVLSGVAPKWLVVWGLILSGLELAVIGYFDNFIVVTLIMFGIGLCVGPINAGITSLMQLVVPNEQMGRVGGGFGTMIDMAMLLSVSLAGAFGSWLGIPIVFTISGVLSIGAGLLAVAFLPALTLHDKVAGGPVEPVEAVS